MPLSLSDVADLRRGTFRFTDFRFSEILGNPFRVVGKADVTLVESGDFTYPKAPRPNAPPVSLTVDFEKVRPSENVVGRYGSIREALQWCTHVTGKTCRFRAALKQVPHANVCSEFLKGVSIPVYVNTTVSYRIRPLSPAVATAHHVAFDYHFTDGSIMRDSPNPSWPGQTLKPGEWNEVTYRLRGSAGKTIDYIMLRLDVRNKPADVYEAEFDSIRFNTKVHAR